MKTHRTRCIKRLSLSFLTGLVFWGSTVASGARVDHTLYGRLLQKYVRNGVVDYQGFKREEAILDRYLSILEKTDPNALARNEQFAFFINAYNAWTLKLILSGYPGITSIKDLGTFFKSPWKKKIDRIHGDVVTLDTLEHDILRPRFKDPRMHFALNCASKGCPPLRSKPYEGYILDQQLEEATEAFINDPDRNHLEGDTLYVSSIFKWYAEDFNNDMLRFIVTYAKGAFGKDLKERQAQIRLEYLDYDWSLNGK